MKRARVSLSKGFGVVWAMWLFVMVFSPRAMSQTPPPDVDVFTVSSGLASASVRAVTPAPSNNFYVVALGSGSIVQNSITLSSAAGSFSALILKPVNGAPLWSRPFAANISIWDTTAMPDGGIVMVGDFSGSAAFPTNASNTITANSTGASDIFLVRYGPDGTMTWLRTLGGSLTDHAAGVAVDEDGNIAVTGRLGGNATVGGQFVSGAGLFVAKYGVNGNFQWVRSVTGGSSQATGISAGLAGNFYVGGVFAGAISAGGIALASTGYPVSTRDDVLILNYDANGNMLWVRQSGGVSTDSLAKVRTSPDGGVVCEGMFTGTAVIGAAAVSATGNYDGFIVRLDADGNWVWTSTVPGAGEETPIGLGVDPLGNIYAGGYFDRTMTLGTTNLTSTSLPALDAFIIRKDDTGETEWAVQLGGGNRQNINDLRLLGDDEGYFWGDFASQIVVGTDTYTGASGGVNNGFYGIFYSTRPPRIVMHPTNTFGVPGLPLSLRVKVSTFFNLRYQWYKGTTLIPNATNAVFTIPSLSAGDVDTYYVTVNNNNGGVTSDPAQVSLYDVPVFTVKPVSLGGITGGSVTNTAEAVGFPAPVLRWRKVGGGAFLATGNEFILDPIDFTSEGMYEVAASNVVGITTMTFHVGANLVPQEKFYDMAHDAYRNVLYLTSGTSVLRYGMVEQGYMNPFVLGGNLKGVDMSPDGRWLVIADEDTTAENNWVHIVNLETGQRRKVNFERVAGEGPTEFVAFGSDGRAVISSSRRLRSLNVTNDHLVEIETTAAYQLKASGSGAFIALGAIENGNGTVGVYSVAATNILAGTYSEGQTLIDVGIEQREEQTIAVSQGRAVFLNASRQMVDSVGNGSTDGPLGAAYHPFEKRVYLPWLNTPEVRVYDTDTFTEVGRYSSGTVPYVTGGDNREGQAKVTRSGDLLLVANRYGVRYIQLTAQVPLILQDPLPTRGSPGFTVKFSVQAYSGYELTYQWQKDEEDIEDATGAEYELVVPEQSAGPGGRYRVRVTNAAGSVYSAEALLTVLRHDPGLTWNVAENLTYGELLSASQLNATAVAAGTFVYNPPLGTKLNAGPAQVLQVVFTPNDLVYYEPVTNYVLLDVLKKRLTFPVNNVSRMYGIPNSTIPLTVSGFVNGESLADLDELPVVVATATESSPIGAYSMTYGGGRDDNYTFAFGTGTLTVTKRTVAITLGNLSQVYNATPRTITATPVPAEAPLQITYNGSLTPPTAIGGYPVQATVTSSNYQGTVTGTLTIFKGAAAITWNAPSPMLYGNVVGAAQFNAVAAVQGIYSYSPPAGTVLGPGTHTLQLIFTPLDSANYLRSTNTVTITITTPVLVQPEQVPGEPGTFRFGFGTVNGKQYDVQASTDLVQWTTVTTLTANGTTLQFTDTGMSSFPRRFYRIVPKP
ncbi:MAG TPA: MBG domain-containing protein [Verrucomicrobiae bacterium]